MGETQNGKADLSEGGRLSPFFKFRDAPYVFNKAAPIKSLNNG